MEISMAFTMLFLTCCSITDCRKKKIPGIFLLIGIVGGMAAVSWRIWQGSDHWYSVLLSAAPGLLLWGLSALTEEKVGRGDGDMVIILGLLLGWERCTALLCAASLLAAVYAGIGLGIRKLKKSSRIPFAPFLSVSCALVWGMALAGGRL